MSVIFQRPANARRALRGAAAILLALAAPAVAASSALELTIQEPASGLVLTGGETSIPIRGGATVHGGVQQIDIVLVMDVSSSLKDTDPDDRRKAGAIGLVESLPAWSDIQVGVVSFGRRAELVSPLSSDREAAIAALGSLGRGSTTNLAGGIETAMAAIDASGRDGAMQVMLVFTDGRSNEKRARRAMEAARAQGVAIHTLQLGTDDDAENVLRDLATETGGSFLQVSDPAELPNAFLDLRTAGIERVTVQVNDGEAIEAGVTLGSFEVDAPLVEGDNVIVATVVDRAGRSHSERVTVTVRPPGCAELEVRAQRGGQPVISLSERSVELVVDASRSMWGQIEGEAKMAIAKRTIDDALGWLPQDLQLSLRAYGHQSTPKERNCRDTALMVRASADNRAAIRAAVASLKPRGQTPLGFALGRVADDIEGIEGERAIVLVTDGIESCDGDPVAAARALQTNGPVPVHVIGFGMAGSDGEDLDSLRAVADASGGRFFTAGSADELREALETSVGTPFHVMRGEEPVASGTLGAGETFVLSPGPYTVRIDSRPERETAVVLESEVRHGLVFDGNERAADTRAWRDGTAYRSCEGIDGLAAVTTQQRDTTGGRPAAPQATSMTPAPGEVPAAPSPVAPASRASASARGDGGKPPLARRAAVFEVEGGRVELWQNLRPERSADWGVIVRHPSVGDEPKMIHTGNDEAEAERRARAARDRLQAGDAAGE